MSEQLTFFGIPSEKVENIVKGTIAIIGSKISSKSMHSSCGNDLAAKAIREVSIEYTGYIPALDFDLFDYDLVDLGDYDRDEIALTVKAVINAGGLPIIIGGDHITTFYSLKEISFQNILWLDAHLDLAKSGEIQETEEYSHAAALRLILEKKNVSARVVGFRGYSTLKEEIKRANQYDVRYYPPQSDIIKKLLMNAEIISLDLDFFDMIYFPAVRVPEPFGINPIDFLRILREICIRPKYFDIVEYCPLYDPHRVHGKFIAILLLEIIAAVIRGRQKGV